MKEGGARYNLTGVSLSGTGTLVDSLQAIETLVFKARTYSLAQLAKMMRMDFLDMGPGLLCILNTK